MKLVELDRGTAPTRVSVSANTPSGIFCRWDIPTDLFGRYEHNTTMMANNPYLVAGGLVAGGAVAGYCAIDEDNCAGEVESIADGIANNT